MRTHEVRRRAGGVGPRTVLMVLVALGGVPAPAAAKENNRPSVWQAGLQPARAEDAENRGLLRRPVVAPITEVGRGSRRSYLVQLRRGLKQARATIEKVVAKQKTLPEQEATRAALTVALRNVLTRGVLVTDAQKPFYGDPLEKLLFNADLSRALELRNEQKVTYRSDQRSVRELVSRDLVAIDAASKNLVQQDGVRAAMTAIAAVEDAWERQGLNRLPPTQAERAAYARRVAKVKGALTFEAAYQWLVRSVSDAKMRSNGDTRRLLRYSVLGDQRQRLFATLARAVSSKKETAIDAVERFLSNPTGRNQEHAYQALRAFSRRAIVVVGIGEHARWDSVRSRQETAAYETLHQTARAWERSASDVQSRLLKVDVRGLKGAAFHVEALRRAVRDLRNLAIAL